MIAGIYARKSTDQTAVAEAAKSVTRQIEHARAYAVGKGWTVADEHIYSTMESRARSSRSVRAFCG